MKRPAVFFDRDNTLIACDEYLGDPDKVVLIPGAADAVARARRLGYAAVVISNQSGVARGYFSEDAVHAVNARMNELLREADPQAVIDRHEFCPYHPDASIERYRRANSPLRKPAPGMLYSAAEALDLDLKRSWLIGDAPRDIEAGHAAGCRTILFTDASLKASPAALVERRVEPDLVCSSLAEAMDFIEQHTERAAPEVKAEAAPEKPSRGNAAPVEGAEVELLAPSHVDDVVEHREEKHSGASVSGELEKVHDAVDNHSPSGEDAKTQATADALAANEETSDASANVRTQGQVAQGRDYDEDLRLYPRETARDATSTTGSATTAPHDRSDSTDEQREFAEERTTRGAGDEGRDAAEDRTNRDAGDEGAEVTYPRTDTRATDVRRNSDLTDDAGASQELNPVATSTSGAEQNATSSHDEDRVGSATTAPSRRPWLDAAEEVREARRTAANGGGTAGAGGDKEKPAPVPGYKLEHIANEILHELRRQREQPPSDFSVSKLLGGVVQMIVLFVLFTAYFSRGEWQTLQSLLLLALTLQAMTIALLIMGKQR